MIPARRSSGPRSGGKSPMRREGGSGSREHRDFRGEGQEGFGGRSRFFQKKVCRFCTDRVIFVDYKDIEKLKRYLTEKGKIIPRRITGNCAKCQRRLSRAIKQARQSALLAFQFE